MPADAKTLLSEYGSAIFALAYLVAEENDRSDRDEKIYEASKRVNIAVNAVNERFGVSLPLFNEHGYMR